MDIRAALIASAQAFELMEPGQGSFHDPAAAAQAAAVGSAPSAQHGFDPPLAQPVPMAIGVIAFIPLQTLRSPTRAAAFAPHRRDGLHQRLELGNVVGVGTGYLRRQGDPVRFGDYVMFAARFGAIRGVGPRLAPLLQLAVMRCQSPRATNRVGQPPANGSASLRATAATPPPPANPAAAANRSCRSRSPFLGASLPSQCRS
jgi:hypothetical protein